MDLNVSTEEIDAIKFYLGDFNFVQDSVYRGGCNAYQTINALLNYGFRNEVDKAKEGKIVELYDVEHFKSYLKLIKLIFEASLKYRNKISTSESNFTSYRVDRFSSFKEFTSHNGIIEGFFSTCKYGFLPQYANTKKDIVLLEIVRDSSVPYLDFQDLLKKYYSKPEEAEILVPFGTKINTITEVALTSAEKNLYRDKDGNPPRGKWIVNLTLGEYKAIDSDLEDSYYSYICNEGVLSRVMKIMKRLSSEEELSNEDIAFYSDWKVKLIAYIDSYAYKLLKIYSFNDKIGSNKKRCL